MGVTSEILGNSGSSHVIEHAGKQYRFRLIDQAVQSAWEKRLYEKDIEAVKIQKDAGLLDAQEYAAQLARLTAAYRDGEYEMLSPGGMKLLTSMSGVRQLLTLLLQCPADEMLQLLLAKKLEVVEKVRLIIAESFPGVDMTGGAVAAVSGEGGSPNG